MAIEEKEIKHLSRGNDFIRRKWNAAEKVFAANWEKANKKEPAINGGFGTLELLLNDSRWAARPFIMGDVKRWRPISQRDAWVAATVVQWLGTNCGDAFLKDCEREIERLRKLEQAAVTERRKFDLVARLAGYKKEK